MSVQAKTPDNGVKIVNVYEDKALVAYPASRKNGVVIEGYHEQHRDSVYPSYGNPYRTEIVLPGAVFAAVEARKFAMKLLEISGGVPAPPPPEIRSAKDVIDLINGQKQSPALCLGGITSGVNFFDNEGSAAYMSVGSGGRYINRTDALEIVKYLIGRFGFNLRVNTTVEIVDES